jgi:hypothetical protein
MDASRAGPAKPAEDGRGVTAEGGDVVVECTRVRSSGREWDTRARVDWALNVGLQACDRCQNCLEMKRKKGDDGPGNAYVGWEREEWTQTAKDAPHDHADLLFSSFLSRAPELE